MDSLLEEPEYKRLKTNEDELDSGDKRTNVAAQFCSDTGECAGPPMELPLNLPKEKLQEILNTLLEKDMDTPYSFFIEEKEILGDIQSALDQLPFFDEERTLKILYQPQAVFKVLAVTRCTASIQGHSQPILHASFNPDGQFLASGSGDCTVRFWDVLTETPRYVCKGFKTPVLVTVFSPDGGKLATASEGGKIIVWDATTGKQIGKTMIGHKKYITSLCWEPLHLSKNGESVLLASAGKDGDIRIWNTVLGNCVKVLSSHTMCVKALRWSGNGLIYSASQDRTIKVWRASDGVLCRTLLGHGHWVNTLALNTDYVLRTGATDSRKLLREGASEIPQCERIKIAKKRYEDALAIAGEERMVSGSDDFTLFLWEPSKDRKPIGRMTGHQQLINDVKFSPDTRYIASASFDKSIRIWNGVTGKFICVLRGHVQGVYLVSWSADSRLLVSGSKDSTLKVWDIAANKLKLDLPGHADEVYAVDWSPDGQRVVSGGKDKVLKLWRQ